LTTVAHLLKIKLRSLEIRAVNLDFERAFHAAFKERAGAIIPTRTSILIGNMRRIVDLVLIMPGLQRELTRLLSRRVPAGCDPDDDSHDDHYRC
jgi:hypothetical protein